MIDFVSYDYFITALPAGKKSHKNIFFSLHK